MPPSRKPSPPGWRLWRRPSQKAGRERRKGYARGMSRHALQAVLLGLALLALVLPAAAKTARPAPYRIDALQGDASPSRPCSKAISAATSCASPMSRRPRATRPPRPQRPSRRPAAGADVRVWRQDAEIFRGRRPVETGKGDLRLCARLRRGPVAGNSTKPSSAAISHASNASWQRMAASIFRRTSPASDMRPQARSRRSSPTMSGDRRERRSSSPASPMAADCAGGLPRCRRPGVAAPRRPRPRRPRRSGFPEARHGRPAAHLSRHRHARIPSRARGRRKPSSGS